MNKILSILAIWLCSVATFAQLNTEDSWDLPANPAVATSSITVAVNEAAWGVAEIKTPTTYGENVYPEGVSVSLVATPSSGYHFVKWVVGETTVSTDASCSYVIPDNDVEVKAVFEVSQFKVTFISEGEELQVQTLDYGTAITAPDDPTKTGYTFRGWSPAVAQTVPANDVTYTAQFEINKYDVIFNVEGELYSKSSLEYGSAITAPEYPAKTGYDFSGWTVDATVPDHNVTYDGSFIVKKYKVTFDADNGTENIVEYLDFGSAIVAPAEEPTKTGYSFNGWSPAVEGAVVPANDITFTANWNVNSYKVTFDVDGVTTDATVDFGAVIPVPKDNPTKEGFEFAGWSPAVAETMPAENVTYTATWTRNKYVVSFISDGVVVKSETLDYESEITAPADPTKLGYTFLGWNPAVDAVVPAHDVTYTASFGTGEFTVTFMVDGQVYKTYSMDFGELIALPEEAPTKVGHTFAGWEGYTEGATIPAENIVFNALWTVNKYAVTFISEGDTVKSDSIAFGSDVVTPADPERVGYSFDGWTPAVAEVVPASNLTYTATWVINKYNVAFEVDGKTYSTSNLEYNTAITAPEVNPEKIGYTFAGWKGYEDGMTVPANDVTFAALWNAKKYVVTFVSEGDTVKMDSVAFGSEIVLPAEPEKAGYSFEGWAPAVAESMPANDVLYTAIFSVNKYTVSFVVDGNVVKTETLDFGSLIVAPEDPSKEGYEFAGWTPEVVELVPDSNVVYTAQFNVNSYNVVFIIGNDTLKSDVLDFGAAITAPEVPAKEGYTFSGWSEFPSTVPANDVVVTGSFTLNKYNVVFVIGDDTIKSEVLDFGAAITAPEVSAKEGYTFNGWSEFPSTVPANDVVVTGSFTLNKYNVVFVIGEDTIKSDILDFGAAITAPEVSVKEGYTFSGWSEFPSSVPANDVVVTGSFTLNKYNVIFVIGEDTIKSEVLDFGTEITAPETPVKEGYTFDGWSEFPSTVPANDVVVTGSFTEKPSAISSVKVENAKKARKTFVNGKIVISVGEKEYNVNGGMLR